MPRLIGPGFLTLLTVATVLASGSQALANHVQCGDVITQDTTLDADLIDCPGDGIVIGASDITLDLGGHTVDGSAVGYGIGNGRYGGVTIRDGNVHGFAVGIGLDFVNDNAVMRLRVGESDIRGIWLYAVSGTLIEDSTVSSGIMLMAEGNTLLRNRISHSRGHGIHAFDAGANRIEQNIVSRNGGDGIHGFGMGSTLMQRNLIVANGGTGISTDDGSTGNRIEGNRIWDNGGAGVSMYAAAHENRLEGNSVLRNRAGGILLSYGNGNEIRDNRISANGGRAGIVFSGDGVYDNLIEGNRLSRNSGDGIFLEPDTCGNLVRRNLALGNADDGVDSDSAFNTFARNLAVHNGDLGIEAEPGVIDGGGNRAFANGNPLQCLNIFCR